MEGLPEKAAAAMARTLQEAEGEMLALLARRAAAGRTSGYDVWAARKAIELRQLRAALRAGVDNLDEVVARQIIEQIRAGYTAALGTSTTPSVVAGLAAEAVGNLQAVPFRMLRDVEDAYRIVQAEVAQLVATGTQTLPTAIQKSLDRYADKGITGFVDSAGRAWEMQAYAEMQTRTAVQRAQLNGKVDRWEREGEQFFIVSDSPEECPWCRPWEGRIVTRGGRSRTPDGKTAWPLSEAEAAGLFHPNCTHTLGLYVPGLTRPMRNTANPEGNELRNRQRSLERNVRRWKRRKAVAFTPEAEAHAKKYLGDARKRYRTFIDDNDRIPVGWRTRVLDS